MSGKSNRVTQGSTPESSQPWRRRGDLGQGGYFTDSAPKLWVLLSQRVILEVQNSYLA